MDVVIPGPDSCRSPRGFTLAELLIVLAIGAIVLTTAMPALFQLVQKNRLTTEINLFVAYLQTARSEAIRRNIPVILCPSRGGTRCDKGYDWTDGWLMFASKNGNRERELDEEILRVGQALNGQIRVRSSPRRRRIIYQPVGFSAGTNATFSFCDQTYTVAPRVICLSNTGRPRISDRDCSGKSISCP